MKKQKQEKIIPIGMAKVIAYSSTSFNEKIPNSVCELLEKYSEYKDKLILDLFLEISNREGCHYFNGYSNGVLTQIFWEYYKELKSLKYSIAYNVYYLLSNDYLKRDKEERDRSI